MSVQMAVIQFKDATGNPIYTISEDCDCPPEGASLLPMIRTIEGGAELIESGGQLDVPATITVIVHK